MTNREVAEKYGASYSQVQNYRTQLGVHQDERTRRREATERANRARMSDVGFTREQAETMTVSELVTLTGLTVGTIQKRRQAQGWHGPQRGQRSVEYDETIPDPTTPEAFEELVEAYAAVKDIDKKYDQRRHAVAAKVPGEGPIGVVFSGDWQLGSWGVDVRAWRADMRFIQDFRAAHPGALYLIGMGDYVSNLGVLDHRGSQFRDLIQPGFQLRLVRAFFTMTAGSWLGLLAGCHDTFSQKATDIDTLDEFIRLAATRHLWHGVELTLKLGSERYALRVRHRYRYNSSLNELNSQRQQAAMEGPADVIAHAHFHTAVSGTMKAGGRPTIMLRSGSYQVHDDYARQYIGNTKAEPVFPMVLFWPDKHKTMLFHDFKDGLDYLASLRN